jgi:uncharacterized protein YndB with AHSA1/START domain
MLFARIAARSSTKEQEILLLFSIIHSDQLYPISQVGSIIFFKRVRGHANRFYALIPLEGESLMARRLEATILINRPAEDIFRFLTNPENHPKFVPGMIEFNKLTPGSLGQVGATARGVRRFLGAKMDLPYEITEVEPGNKLGMKGKMGPLHFNDGYILEAMGSNTRVKFWLEFTLSGVLKLARPFLAIVGKTHAHETLTNLKKALEISR